MGLPERIPTYEPEDAPMPEVPKFNPPTVPHPKTNTANHPNIPNIRQESSPLEIPRVNRPTRPVEPTPRPERQSNSPEKNKNRVSSRKRGQKVIALLLATTAAITIASKTSSAKKSDITEPTKGIGVEDYAGDYNDKYNLGIDEAQDQEAETSEQKLDDFIGPINQELDNRNKASNMDIDVNVKLELTDTMKKEINRIKEVYAEKQDLFEDIAKEFESETGVEISPELIAAICYRETNFNEGWGDCYLHNGQKLGQTTTQVPKGIYFAKGQFKEAAVDALKSVYREQYNAYGAKNHGVKDKSLKTSIDAMIVYAWGYNGYIKNSPYAWSGTNRYSGEGMYTSDSHYDPNATDQRPGIAAILISMAEDPKST